MGRVGSGPRAKLPGVRCSVTICVDEEGFEFEDLTCELPEGFPCTMDSMCDSNNGETPFTQSQCDAAKNRCHDMCPTRLCESIRDGCYNGCEDSAFSSPCRSVCDTNWGICRAGPSIVDKFGYLANCEASCEVIHECTGLGVC